MKAILLLLAAAATLPAQVRIIPLLPPGPVNPRNTEGDFIRLRDGRYLFVYSKFTGGGGDDDAGYLAGRYSSDDGRTWTSEDLTIVTREGRWNVMSASLLRLKDGRIGLFYLRKNSETDDRVWVRFSSDETKTWSEPRLCTPDEGYFVLNNDRAVQMKSGRIVLPVALHTAEGKWTSRGLVMMYLSDDGGKTWRRSRQTVECPTPSRNGLQEPGVLELRDGRLWLFARTSMGSQYQAWSRDGGETWTKPEPSNLASPLSPASIERIPKTGDLLAVWNDHSGVDDGWKAEDGVRGGRRTPLTLAISRDEGRTWEHRRNLLQHPDGWYCYTAIDFVGDTVLLAFNSGGEEGLAKLSRTQIARVPLDWIYGRSNK